MDEEGPTAPGAEGQADDDERPAPLDEPAPRRRRLLLRLLAWMGSTSFWLITMLLCGVGSVAYHLQLPLAGVVAVEAVAQALDGAIQGELVIGEVSSISWDKVVAQRVTVRDPQGREVVRLARIAAFPNWGALAHGTIFIDRVRARDGQVVLYVSEDGESVSLVDAFLPPPTDEEEPDDVGDTPIRVVVDDIVLDGVDVRGDVPSYEGLHVEDLRVAARVSVGDSLRFDIWGARGVMTGPYPGHTDVTRVVGFYDTNLEEEGLVFRARARRGEDHIRARIELTRPDPEAPPEMELVVLAEPIRMSTLAQMEIAPGLDNLRGTFRGRASLEGPTDELRLSADLTSAAGRVHIRGELPSEGALVFEAWPEDELRLAELVPAAPALRLGGRARISIAPEDETGERERRVSGSLEPLTVEGFVLPAFTVDGVLEDEALVVRSLDAPHAGGETSASGRVGFDGSLDVHAHLAGVRLEADPNVRRLAPDARGLVDASLDVRADPELENLRFDGRITLREARYSSVRAERLSVSGHVSNLGASPVLRVDGDADGLQIGEFPLGHASYSLHGGPGRYDVRVDAESLPHGTRVALSGQATASARLLTLRSESVLVDLGPGGAWQGGVDVALRPSHSLEVARLEFARGSGTERVSARGTYRFNGDDNLIAEVTGLDLASLRPLAPNALEGLGGNVTGQVSVEGDLDGAPRIAATVSVREGRYRHLSDVDGDVELRLDEEGLAGRGDVTLGTHGHVSLEGRLPVDGRALMRDPLAALQDADLSEVSGRAAGLDLGLLARLGLVEDLPIEGRISTAIDLGGTARDPGLRRAVIVVDRLALPGWDPMRAKVRLSYSERRLRIHEGWVADSGGELLALEANLPLSFDDLPENASEMWAQLHEETWSASVRLPQRRMEGWPAPLSDYAIPGLSISASVTAEGDASGPRALLAAVGHFEELPEDAGTCATDADPIIMVDGRLEGERARAIVHGFLGAQGQVLQGTVDATLPLEGWVRDGVRSAPPTEVRADLLNAELSELPLLCRYGQGRVNATITVKDMLTAHPVLGAIFDAPRLRLWEIAGEQGEARLSPEYRVHARAGSSPDRRSLTACTIIGAPGDGATPGARCRETTEAADGELVARVRMPVEWTVDEALPSYREGAPVSAWADFGRVHMEPVLAVIPGIVGGDVVMDGTLELSGPLERPWLSGRLALSDGHLQVDGLGQHLHEISGGIEFDGDAIRVPEDQPLVAVDTGGRVTAFGEVMLDGLWPRVVTIDLDAAQFPIRREGMVLASLTGRARVSGQVQDEETRMTVVLSQRAGEREFTVRMPEQTAATLQSLGTRADILVVGSERPASSSGPRESYPLRISIDASRPFRVSRNDFTADVSAHLVATYQDPSFTVEGQAVLQRGTFEIFGKRFALQRGGSLNFDGGEELDPQVDIDAVYEIPSRAGASVTVHVGGSLTHPEVSFSSTEASDRAEIIALLVSGGRRESGTADREVAEQAASFLSGLTAGILTLGLREEFGDVIPVLAIESQGAAGTRVRVGIDANELIPDFLEGIVLGAYIEGFVTAGQEQNSAGSSAGGGGVGGGVSLEFILPSNFLMRGTYVPVDNGSLDLLFEP